MGKSQIVTICRQYGTHQATPEFNRILTTVVRNGVILPKAVVQYFFKESVKVPVVVRSHGNSSCTNRPYYRTQPSALDNIKERCTNKPASMVYTDVFEAAGGIKGSNSMLEEPRNMAQIYNRCSQQR